MNAGKYSCFEALKKVGMNAGKYLCFEALKGGLLLNKNEASMTMHACYVSHRLVFLYYF
jgi:hypothetical protein